MSKVNYIIPSCIENFRCIQGDCEDTCCIGWRVDIDEKTYKKYLHVKDIGFKKKLKDNTVKQRSKPSFACAAKMRLIDNRCSFLNEKNLCDIHGNLGESFLCNTCNIYPRIIKCVNNSYEMTLTLSCPEACRQILLNKNSINFMEIENEQHTILNSIIRYSTDTINELKDLFEEIRYISLLIIQDRRLILDDRLILLGLFINEVNNYVETSKLQELPNYFQQFIDELDKGNFNGAFKNIEPNYDTQLKLSKELIFMRLDTIITSLRYKECLSEMLLGLNIFETETTDITLDLYTSAINEYYKPFMNEHEYMLENYLVNYIFKNNLGFDCESIMESYARMILHYAIIRLHLIGMAKRRNGLNEDAVIKCVQSISKTFEHNASYFEKVLDNIKKNDLLKLEDLCVLIRI